MANRTISDLYYEMRDILGRVITTGNIYFVSSTATGASDTDGRSGRDPANPVATIDYAVSLCTANQGDYIVVMPGHAEVVSAAGDLTLDIAGITVLGLGSGADQPTVTLDTANTATVVIGAANVTVENINFVQNFADIASCIDVDADDFTLRNCRFTEAANNMNFVICVLDAAAGGSDRITIEGCYAICQDASNTHFVSFTGTGDGHIVKDNILIGDWGTAAIGGAGIVTNVAVLGNRISNTATDADSGIELHASTTGLVMDNLIGIALAGDATTGVSAAGCACCENYVVDIGDRQGVLDPAAT